MHHSVFIFLSMDELVEFVAGRRKKRASLVAQPIKNLPANAGGAGSVPEWGRSPGEGKGCPLQDPGLEDATDYTVHGWQRVGRD